MSEELEHVDRRDIHRCLVDHREERLQVVRDRPQRVRPAPPANELEIPIHDRITQHVTGLARGRHRPNEDRKGAHPATLPAALERIADAVRITRVLGVQGHPRGSCRLNIRGHRRVHHRLRGRTRYSPRPHARSSPHRCHEPIASAGEIDENEYHRRLDALRRTAKSARRRRATRYRIGSGRRPGQAHSPAREPPDMLGVPRCQPVLAAWGDGAFVGGMPVGTVSPVTGSTMRISVCGRGGPTVTPLSSAVSEGSVLVRAGEHSVWP